MKKFVVMLLSMFLFAAVSPPSHGLTLKEFSKKEKVIKDASSHTVAPVVLQLSTDKPMDVQISPGWQISFNGLSATKPTKISYCAQSGYTGLKSWRYATNFLHQPPAYNKIPLKASRYSRI